MDPLFPLQNQVNFFLTMILRRKWIFELIQE